MNNDLISRKYMKEAIEQFFVIVKYYHPYSKGRKTIPTEEVLDIIDNAPTVPLPDFKDGYKQAIIDGKTNFSRPQGEWIYHKDFNESCRYGCNQCGNLTNIPGNFCPNCGSDMRKGD